MYNQKHPKVCLREKQTFSETKRKFGVATQLDFPFLSLKIRGIE
jgi:hypothetical protein